MTDYTNYYLHLHDNHGRGRRNPAPLTVDMVNGQLLKSLTPPSPAVTLNTIVRGRTSGCLGRVTRIIDETTWVIESIPHPVLGATGGAFTQNNVAPGSGEYLDFDNCEGTARGYLVNHAGTYAIGTTSIAVDTGLGTMLVGDRIKFAGHATLYTVATALTAGTVVISPGLTATVADNEAVTLRGGEAQIWPLGDAQNVPTINQYVLEHHDERLSKLVPDDGADFPYWDRNAKICETIAVLGSSLTGSAPYFRKGDELGSSSGGRCTVQLITVISGDLAIAITRKRGAFNVGDTLTNLTSGGSTGTLIANAIFGPTPQGVWVPYCAIPNNRGLGTFFEYIPNGNGTDGGQAGVGPENRLMHSLHEYHRLDPSVGNRGFRMVPFSSFDAEGPTDGNLGSVSVQVVKCSGTFPASGTLVAGQTVTGPGGWSATVHGWNNGSKLLFVRKTNGAVLGAGTLTLSGGATVTGTGPAYGWQKGSTHWNAMVAEITKSTTASNALFGTAPAKWRHAILQPWETELAVHHPTYGAAFPSTDQFREEWIRWTTDLRTLLGDASLPLTVWKGRPDMHVADIYVAPGVGYAYFLGEAIESLLGVIDHLTVARSTDYAMADDQTNLWLRTDDYVDLGDRFFRHMKFGQVQVVPGDGFEEVAVGVFVGQSQKTGYIQPGFAIAFDRDPEMWPSSQFSISPPVNTVDGNMLVWNPITEQIEALDVSINGNGSWGTTPGTCGPDLPVCQRMKRRFSSDPVQSTRFIAFKFTVPGSCLNANVPDATGTWDPSITARPTTTATCTVAQLPATSMVPARGRFTATSGTFTGDKWIPGLSCFVTGSGLGVQSLGGNNSPPYTVQQVYAVDPAGAWVEIIGAGWNAETHAFTLTAGPPPIMPEFKRQWRLFVSACRDIGVIPRTKFIDFEQGESDLHFVNEYQAAMERVWAELVATCARRPKGEEPVAKCITLLHSKTPWPVTDSAVEQMRQIQRDVAAGLGNCVVVDPSDLPMEVNTFGTYPRINRLENGVHHSGRAMLIKGFRVDAALATLGPTKGIPAHPQGELAVDFGAINGGTTQGFSVDGDSDGSSFVGTDAVTPPELDPETGDGLDAADSYQSLAEAEVRIASRANVPAQWATATDAQKTLWLREAAVMGIDLAFGPLWQGLRTNEHQALEWPRMGVVNMRSGRGVLTNVIPDAIPQMQIEWALMLAQGIDPLRSLDPDKDAHLVATAMADSLPGGFSESRTFGDGRSAVPTMPRMWLLAQPFLVDRGEVGLS